MQIFFYHADASVTCNYGWKQAMASKRREMAEKAKWIESLKKSWYMSAWITIMMNIKITFSLKKVIFLYLEINFAEHRIIFKGIFT